MTHPLQNAFDELSDILSDFETVGYQGAESIFRRFIAAIEAEPLGSLMDSLLPPVEFPDWYAAAERTVGSMVGSGELNWPVDRAERVAMMRELFRAIGRGNPSLFGVSHTFTYGGSGRYGDDFQAFSERIARPFLRDLSRLVDLRAEPPVLSESVARPFPATGDQILDDLLRAARDGFRDPSPTTRRVALEKLWDAWERLKTLDSKDKRLSVETLLSRASADPSFRSLLESEARALTAIGNDFHIRHFETSRSEISAPRDVDYLFHRMWALVWRLLLSERARSIEPAA